MERIKEMRLVGGEITFRIDVQTLVNNKLDNLSIEEILIDLAAEEIAKADVEVDIFEEIEMDLDEDTEYYYENAFLNDREWEEILQEGKGYEE